MNNQQNTGTAVRSKAIATCSGASLSGRLADLTARQLVKQGHGRMICLAGVSAKIPEILAGLERATLILVIDGCPRKCAKRTLEGAGFSRVRHFCISDIDSEIDPDSPEGEERLVYFLAQRAEEIMNFGERAVLVVTGNCEHDAVLSACSDSSR